MEQPTSVALSPSALDPQLVIFHLRVTAHGHDGLEGRLLQGLLHIRTPAGTKTPGLKKKLPATREALTVLERKANLGVVQPVACVLAGNVNLSKQIAALLVQPASGEPDLITRWHIETSNAALFGDVAFIRGTAPKAFDVSIGRSYKDRGVRHDQHDFFGNMLRMLLVKAPSPPTSPPKVTSNIPTEAKAAKHVA